MDEILKLIESVSEDFPSYSQMYKDLSNSPDTESQTIRNISAAVFRVAA